MSKSDNSSAGLAKSAAVVSFAVMCSRVLGLIREQVFAGLFGAGYAYDSFVVAFRIPNLLRDLFGEGALSAAFVSVFSDYNAKRSKEETWQLASNVLCFFIVAISIITLLAIYFSDQIVALDGCIDLHHRVGVIVRVQIRHDLVFSFPLISFLGCRILLLFSYLLPCIILVVPKV